MKYVTMRVNTGDQMAVETFAVFHDHLNHIDVANAMKPVAANSFGENKDVEFLGAGFLWMGNDGKARVNGVSTSMDLKNRGALDEDIINTAQLKLGEWPEKPDHVVKHAFGELAFHLFTPLRQLRGLQLVSLGALKGENTAGITEYAGWGDKVSYVSPVLMNSVNNGILLHVTSEDEECGDYPLIVLETALSHIFEYNDDENIQYLAQHGGLLKIDGEEWALRWVSRFADNHSVFDEDPSVVTMLGREGQAKYLPEMRISELAQYVREHST